MRRLTNSAPVRQPAAGSALELDGLSAYLCVMGYDSEPRCQILRRVIDDGHLDGAVPLWLDAADLADATEVLVSTQLSHPQESSAWGNRSDEPSMFRPADDVWSLGPAVPPDAPLVPPELDQDAEDEDAEGDADRLDRRIRELVEGWEPQPDTDPFAAAAIESMRHWYRTTPSFAEWLDAENSEIEGPSFDDPPDEPRRR